MSGSFDLDVSVTKAAGEIATAATVAIIKDEGAMRCTLQKGGTYTIVLSMTPDSTVKGYCSVVMNGTRQEITAPISQDPAIGVSPLIFTVTTGEEDVTVVFCAKWGYPAAPTIQHGDVIAFGADEVSDAV